MRQIPTLLLIAVFISGCAVFKPFVSADDVLLRSNANRPVDSKTPSPDGKESARGRAVALKDILHEKAMDYYRFDQISGLLLIGAGITAAGFGIFDGPRDGILAAGLPAAL
jgi:hypothetical protein